MRQHSLDMDRQQLVRFRRGQSPADAGLRYEVPPDLWGHELNGRSLTRSTHAPPSSEINPHSCYSLDHHSHSPEPFNMAQYFTESEHLQFREADLDQQRVLGLGNAFTRVPFGSTYNQERVMKLGFAFTNVPMSVAQEDYIRMRTAQGASAQEDSFSQVSCQSAYNSLESEAWLQKV